MGMYKYTRELWKKPQKNLRELMKERLIKWRQEPVTVRIERPTRLDRARSLGYKAKQGVLVIRQRVPRGGRMRPNITGGRRPKHNRQRMSGDKSYKRVAEERANKKFVNCEVLNSYEVAKDGKNYWFEVILLDKNHPSIKKDKDYSNIVKQEKRVLRGLTATGKKGRGLNKKGKGAEKVRPGINANQGRAK